MYSGIDEAVADIPIRALVAPKFLRNPERRLSTGIFRNLSQEAIRDVAGKSWAGTWKRFQKSKSYRPGHKSPEYHFPAQFLGEASLEFYRALKSVAGINRICANLEPICKNGNDRRKLTALRKRLVKWKTQNIQLIQAKNAEAGRILNKGERRNTGDKSAHVLWGGWGKRLRSPSVSMTREEKYEKVRKSAEFRNELRSLLALDLPTAHFQWLQDAWLSFQESDSDYGKTALPPEALTKATARKCLVSGESWEGQRFTAALYNLNNGSDTWTPDTWAIFHGLPTSIKQTFRLVKGADLRGRSYFAAERTESEKVTAALKAFSRDFTARFGKSPILSYEYDGFSVECVGSDEDEFTRTWAACSDLRLKEEDSRAFDFRKSDEDFSSVYPEVISLSPEERGCPLTMLEVSRDEFHGSPQKHSTGPPRPPPGSTASLYIQNLAALMIQ